MTDQKHTKEPLTEIDKLELLVYSIEKHRDALHSQLTAVTKQRDELREELKQLDFEGGLGFERHARIRAVLTKTKESV